MNDFTYTPVTNTFRINQHLSRCKEEPLIIIQGSQGASKTVSILMLLIDYFRNNPNKEITICSAEKTKLMDTAFNDLKKICIDWNIWREFKWNDVKTKLTRPGSTGFIEFLGLDKDDIGKGRRRDVIYINECNKVAFQKYFDITQRAKKTIVDFNADRRFYIHKLVNDVNFLKVDFIGNEKLSYEERRNILSFKAKGYKLTDDGDFELDKTSRRIVIDEFFANKWRVYGEGEIGTVEGRIYHWKPVDYSDYLKINAKTYYAVDWGKVDPFAIVEAKYYDGSLYVHELNYASENEIEQSLTPAQLHQIKASVDEGLVTWLFNKLGIPKNRPIVCDNNRPSKIQALRRAGWDYAVAIGAKSRLVDRVGMLAGINIYYTSQSSNIESEQEVYCYDQRTVRGELVTLEEPIDRDNHTINAIEYLVQKLFDDGIIKTL